ncbi:MAG: hypothetical protein ACRDH7_09270 [Actinomycetota bacterium]
MQAPDLKNLLTGGDTTNDSTSTTASASPDRNRQPLLIAVCDTRNAIVGTLSRTITGITDTFGAAGANALTWTVVKQGNDTWDSGTSEHLRVEVWQGVGLAVQDGTVTITFSGSTGGDGWSLDQGLWLHRTSPIVQSVANDAADTTHATSGSATLAATPKNPTYGAIAHGANEALTAGTNFVVLGAQGGYNTPNHAVGTESKKVSLSTTIDGSWATSSQWTIVGAELRPIARTLASMGSGG